MSWRLLGQRISRLETGVSQPTLDPLSLSRGIPTSPDSKPLWCSTLAGLKTIELQYTSGARIVGATADMPPRYPDLPYHPSSIFEPSPSWMEYRLTLIGLFHCQALPAPLADLTTAFQIPMGKSAARLHRSVHLSCRRGSKEGGRPSLCLHNTLEIHRTLRLVQTPDGRRRTDPG